MSPGSGDEQYMSVYRDILPGLVSDFSPDMVMVSAGYDLHARDPLAHIMVSDDCLSAIVDSILGSSEAPAVFCLEGGYSLDVLSESVLMTLRALLSK